MSSIRLYSNTAEAKLRSISPDIDSNRMADSPSMSDIEQDFEWNQLEHRLNEAIKDESLRFLTSTDIKDDLAGRAAVHVRDVLKTKQQEQGPPVRALQNFKPAALIGFLHKEAAEVVTMRNSEIGKLNVAKQKLYAIELVKEVIAVQKDTRKVLEKMAELEKAAAADKKI